MIHDLDIVQRPVGEEIEVTELHAVGIPILKTRSMRLTRAWSFHRGRWPTLLPHALVPKRSARCVSSNHTIMSPLTTQQSERQSAVLRPRLPRVCGLASMYEILMLLMWNRCGQRSQSFSQQLEMACRLLFPAWRAEMRSPSRCGFWSAFTNTAAAQN